jgi:hypothetical protein
MVFSMKIVCLLIGYKTVRLGYQLLVDGVSGKFAFKAELKGIKADLRSVSPGLLFVLLGCSIVMYGIYADKTISLQRTGNYGNQIPELEVPSGQAYGNKGQGKDSESH